VIDKWRNSVREIAGGKAKREFNRKTGNRRLLERGHRLTTTHKKAGNKDGNERARTTVSPGDKPSRYERIRTEREEKESSRKERLAHARKPAEWGKGKNVLPTQRTRKPHKRNRADTQIAKCTVWQTVSSKKRKSRPLKLSASREGG